jgi:2-amino-4-hydroxy-6-hydroxymethyldihydropteridine diphosphokinase
VAASRVWESAPVGGPPQGDYLNAAVRLDASLDPLALLDALSAIEHDLGRSRTVKDGPRTIDLDILWMGALILEHPRLVVPHPRLHERAFALLPLLEVAPFATDPRTGVAYTVPHAQRVHPFPESFVAIG